MVAAHVGARFVSLSKLAAALPLPAATDEVRRPKPCSRLYKPNSHRMTAAQWLTPYVGCTW